MTLLIITNALFALTYTLGKYLLGYMPPLYLSGLRMLAGAVLVFGYLLMRNPSSLKIPSVRACRALLINGFFNSFLSYALEFWALVTLTSIKVTFLYNCAPFFSALFSYWFFAERMSFKKWLGLTIGFVGMVPVLLTSSAQEESLMAFGYISWPELAVVVGVIAYCYGWVYVRRLVREEGCAPLMVNAWSMVIGGVCSLGAAVIFEHWCPVHNVWSFSGWFLALVLVGNVMASSLYSLLLKRYSVTLVTLSCLLIPLFATVYGYFFLHEVPTIWFFVSSSIVCAGLYMFYQEELRQGYVVK